MDMLNLQISAKTWIPTIFLGLLSTGLSWAIAAEAPCWPRFHGPQGDNISAETGLLEKWSEAGPPPLWTAQGIGQGYASVAIANGRIFTAGDVGADLVLFALDMDGRILWQVKNGEAWTTTGPASPVMTVTFDQVKQLSEVTPTVAVRGNGYTVTATLPWTLLGVVPKAELKLRGDVGFILSDPSGTINAARIYWSNKNTGLVMDQPSEAMISPQGFGEFILGKESSP
jgi:hypothetical protein